MRGRIEIGPLIGVVGALLLGASLFLDWYRPGLTAFSVFEVWDLALFVLALLSLVGLLSALGVPVPGGESAEGALPILAGSALLLVASQAINHPPAATGHAAASGQWIALAGAGLLASGAGLTVTRFSLAVNLDRERAPSRPRARAADGEEPAPPKRPLRGRSAAAESREAEPDVMGELYPHGERAGPIGADDPEISRAPEDGS